MCQKSVGLLIGVSLVATAANAETLAVANTDITFSGGIDGGYFYSTNTGDTN